jgi:hypothetical protein
MAERRAASQEGTLEGIIAKRRLSNPVASVSDLSDTRVLPSSCREESEAVLTWRRMWGNPIITQSQSDLTAKCDMVKADALAPDSVHYEGNACRVQLPESQPRRRRHRDVSTQITRDIHTPLFHKMAYVKQLFTVKMIYLPLILYSSVVTIRIAETIPVTGRRGLWRCVVLRIPYCLDNRLTYGGEVVSPTHRSRSTPQKHFSTSGTHFC